MADTHDLLSLWSFSKEGQKEGENKLQPARDSYNSETPYEAVCNTSSHGCDLEIHMLLCSYFHIQGSPQTQV